MTIPQNEGDCKGCANALLDAFRIFGYNHFYSARSCSTPFFHLHSRHHPLPDRRSQYYKNARQCGSSSVLRDSLPRKLQDSTLGPRNTQNVQKNERVKMLTKRGIQPQAQMREMPNDLYNDADAVKKRTAMIYKRHHICDELNESRLRNAKLIHAVYHVEVNNRD